MWLNFIYTTSVYSMYISVVVSITQWFAGLNYLQQTYRLCEGLLRAQRPRVHLSSETIVWLKPTQD